MALPIENLPKFAPPHAAPAPKAATEPETQRSSKPEPSALPGKPRIQPPRVVKSVELRRANIADRVEFTNRRDLGKFGHLQPSHTSAPKPAPKAAPGQPQPKAAHRPINILG